MSRSPVSNAKIAFTGLAATLVFVTGCHESRETTYPVHGSVSYRDGSPVRYGTVECRSLENGCIARGVLNRSGQFSLSTFDDGDGAVAGEHQTIVVQLASPEMMTNRQPRETAAATDHSSHDGTNLVAPLFSKYSSTPLSINVAEDKQNVVELIVDSIPKLSTIQAQ